MPNKWIVGIDPDQEEQGYIIHRQAPEFLAKWGVEPEGEAILSDLVYTDAAEPDSLAIYDFEWCDEQPSEELFRNVCAEGVRVIDRYLDFTAGLKEEMIEIQEEDIV